MNASPRAASRPFGGRALLAASCSALLVALGGAGVRPLGETTMQSTLLVPDTVLRMQVERIGSGPPIVLVGGGLTGWASWQPHAQRLAASREVVRAQLLSVQYGLENRPLPPGYSLRTESNALAAALDEIGWIGPVDFVGWSYGAAITLDFALNHPGRVRTLTLIEPPALWLLPDHGRGMADLQALEALLPDVRDDVSVATLEKFVRAVAIVPPGTVPQALPQWESWVRHRRSLRNLGAPFTHADDSARLRSFEPPVLLVTGTGTAPLLRAVHDVLASTLPNVNTLELPGGHAPQLVAMDDFMARLEDFQARTPAVQRGRMQTVASRDGTRIAFWRSGSGPPLLLVHGATADHTTTWRFVIRELAMHFTVYAMDRRGRGGSGDAPAYDLQREAEDVAAIVDAIGEPVTVLGHSYGGLAAIEAALLTSNLRRLILYESVPLRGADGYKPGVIDRLEALLAAGDLEGVLVSMYRDLVEMPPEELALLRAQKDAWAVRLRNTPTLPREVRTEERYLFAPDRFKNMRTPTVLLVGGASSERELKNAKGVAAALPDARVAILDGQQHAAMYTAPDLFLREVLKTTEINGGRGSDSAE